MPEHRDPALQNHIPNACADSQRYRHLVETSHDLIWSLNAEGRCTFLNERACLAILGYAPSEVLGRSFLEFVAPDHLDSANDKFRSIMGGGDCFRFESVVIRKDGGRVHLSFNAVIERDADGNVMGATGTATDITERQRSLDSVRQSEERLRLALEAGRMGHWDYDFHTRAVVRSAAACDIYGFEPAELMPTHEALLDHIHPEDRERLREANEAAVFSRDDFSVEYRIIDREGKTRWVAERGHVTFDEEGCPARMLGVVMDVTAQKQMEEQLNLSRRLESIGALAGGVAHDFNNVLTAVMLYAELAETSQDAGPNAREYAQKIRAAADRASTLTMQLLAFARKQIIRPAVIDITDHVYRTGELLRRLLGENIELTLRLAPDLGPARVDPTQLEQVLLNLAINARDAMPDGGKLSVSARNLTVATVSRRLPTIAPGDYVLVTVRDTGCGMSETERQRAFEPFFTTKSAGKGTGLGLASCYGIVKQSGGEIWVESEPGKGAKFNFVLPRVEEERRGAAPPSITAAGEASAGTILLVEDEAMLRETAALSLRKRGYRVIEAKDGQDGLKRAEECRFAFDLLMTDVVMPRMGGVALAERVRAVMPGLPVLFVSGHAEPRHELNGIARTAATFLQKPYSSATLAEVVAKLMGCKAGS